MKIKAFKALYPNLEMIASPDSFFGSLKMEFPHYLQNGFFTRTSAASMFVYVIEHNLTRRIGLITSTSVKDILEGNILKHEHTLAEKEQQMLHLALQRNAMIKPVLLAHPMQKKILQVFEEVISQNEVFMKVHFEKEESVHILYQVTDPESIKRIKDEFTKIDKVYIADGHHRVSTGLLLHRNKKKSKVHFGDLLSIYFGFDQLTIFDYNRIVSILKEISPTQLVAELSKYFTIKSISSPRKPSRKHEICFMIHQEAYLLKWKKKYLKTDSKTGILLDAELLDQFVFNKIMGITDVREDSRLSYISGVAGVKGIESSLLKDDYAVGFLLFPVKKDELKKIADAGLTLPPKSTWFEPRIKNGLISQEFQ